MPSALVLRIGSSMTPVNRSVIIPTAGPNGADTVSLAHDSRTDRLLTCEISWPPIGELRARKIVSRSRSIATGKCQSLTLGRATHWESEVERDGQKLVDACRAASSYSEQPLTILYSTPHGKFRHVPDLLVIGVETSPWLIEFKRSDDPELEATYRRAVLLTPPLARLGYRYMVIVGKTLRNGSYLQNAEWLLRYGRRPLRLIEVERARALFEPAKQLLLMQLEQILEGKRIAWNVASRLILDGRLSLDMAAPISARTELTWQVEPAVERDASWLRAAFGVTR